MSAINAKASRKMKKYAVLTREPRCFLGSLAFSWEQRKFDEVFDCTVPNNTLSRAELSYDEGTVLNVHYGDVLIKYGSVLNVQKDDIPRIPHRCREDFNGALLQDGDVIIADTAEDETTGKACEIGNLQGSAIVSGLHTMVCRPRNRMALGYLGYYLNSNAYHHQLLPLMQGIKVLSLSRSNIQKTSVSYPIAVKEQQLIAYYFSQLDNLITLHQRECISFTARAGRLILTANKKRNTSSWEQRKVSELFRVTRGYVLAATQTETTKTDEKPYPVYSSQTKDKGLMGYYKDYLYEDAITWTTDGANAGTVNYRAGKFYCTNVCGVLLSNEVKANQMIAEALNSVAKGYVSYVGNPKLMNNVMADIVIQIPTQAEEREQLSSFFAKLDNLITLHQRKFEKLTNVKKSMLEKMFPQNGSSYPEIRFKGFTDPWEQRKLGDISEIKTGPFGSTLHADDYVSDGTPIITTEHFKTGALPRSKNGLPQVSDSDYKRLTAYTLDDGDIVFSRVGSVDINALITPFQSNWLFSGRVLRVRPQTNISSQFLHTRLETESIKTDIRTRAVGQTMPSINTEILKTTPLVLPSSAAEQEQIGSYFAALDNLITLHQRELEKLQNIKKSMLEKMFV